MILNLMLFNTIDYIKVANIIRYISYNWTIIDQVSLNKFAFVILPPEMVEAGGFNHLSITLGFKGVWI